MKCRGGLAVASDEPSSNPAQVPKRFLQNHNSK